MAYEGSELHDVLIIGAGPCGLAVAARLRESTPSAIFTEEEHARYHWIRRHGQHTNVLARRKNGYQSSDTKALASATRDTPDTVAAYDTLVLDATAAKWMARWNYLFKKYSIEHLRSPMFFHVDPADRDGLLSYAHEVQLQNDIREIRGCVGKEVSKHKRKKRTGAAKLPPNDRVQVDERDRKDYYVPSSHLFRDHCDNVAERYCLGRDMLRKERVADIAYAEDSRFPDEERVFKVKTECGEAHYAKTVVLAVGNGDTPNIAEPFKPHLDSGLISFARDTGPFPTAALREKIESGRETNILIIGGGLTSAQMADLAIERGVSKVWLLTRGDLKVKPFDVDQTWISKYKNHNQACFYSADTDEERMDQIKQARNGGSITPSYHAILRRRTVSGDLSILTDTQVTSASKRADGTGFDIKVTPSHAELDNVRIDHVYSATGMSMSIDNLPFLQTMMKDYPIESCCGLPKLTEDLAWCDGVPLFMTGALAGLRLGPGAGNLAGARLGAERVVWGIKDTLPKQDKGEELSSEDLDSYVSGLGNRFQSLGGLSGFDASDGW